MNSALAAIMNRLSHAPDSIIAQNDSATAFLHGLDPEQTFEARPTTPGIGMVVELKGLLLTQAV